MILVTKMHTNGHSTSKRKEFQETCRTLGMDRCLLSCSACHGRGEGTSGEGRSRGG